MNIVRFENDKAPHAIVDFENSSKLFEDEMLNNITSSVVLRSTFLRNTFSSLYQAFIMYFVSRLVVTHQKCKTISNLQKH